MQPDFECLQEWCIHQDTLLRRGEENLEKFECIFPFSSYRSYHFPPTSFSRFETCWPALMKDSHGVIIIFNPELPSHLKEIEMWYSCFVQQQPLLDSQCLLVAHHKPGSAEDTENLSLGKNIEYVGQSFWVFFFFLVDLLIFEIGHTSWLSFFMKIWILKCFAKQNYWISKVSLKVSNVSVSWKWK